MNTRDAPAIPDPVDGWRPGASLSRLRARAELLARVRDFFTARHVLEVDTPLLGRAGITDPAIEPLTVDRGRSIDSPRFLQTSPEYAMKRLLAAGSGPIFQIARAFRDGEAGGRHNPEFTLLEWYRPDRDYHGLMDEVAALVEACLGHRPCRKSSYRTLFIETLGVDPVSADVAELEAIAREHIDVGSLQGPRDLWLDLLLSHRIEPALADEGGLVFVYDYPASQAALAKIVDSDGVRLAQRFELYVDGVELANGYQELTDPSEQRQRFDADNRRRREMGQQERVLDEQLLAAMAHGLPQCSGVALGIDRLLMLAEGVESIAEVLAFDWSRA